MAARHISDTRTLTLRQWADLPEDTPGELVDGRLVEEEMPTRSHEKSVAWLCTRLLTYLRRAAATC